VRDEEEEYLLKAPADESMAAEIMLAFTES